MCLNTYWQPFNIHSPPTEPSAERFLEIANPHTDKVVGCPVQILNTKNRRLQTVFLSSLLNAHPPHTSRCHLQHGPHYNGQTKHATCLVHSTSMMLGLVGTGHCPILLTDKSHYRDSEFAHPRHTLLVCERQDAEVHLQHGPHEMGWTKYATSLVHSMLMMIGMVGTAHLQSFFSLPLHPIIATPSCTPCQKPP